MGFVIKGDRGIGAVNGFLAPFPHSVEVKLKQLMMSEKLRLPLNKSLITAIEKFNNTPAEFKPKLVYWPAEKKYLTTYIFSDALIRAKGMLVLRYGK